MARQNKGVGFALWVLPHAYNKTGCGNPRLTAAQHCAPTQHCANKANSLSVMA